MTPSVQLPYGSAASGGTTVRIQIDNRPGTAHRSVNRLLLGNNIEWTQRGDGLLQPGSLEFRPALAQRLVALGPTVIRYPGGTLTDTFHWQAAQGSLERRGLLENVFTRKLERADFGTAEFLELCRGAGAEPLITVNVVSGTPAEAAGWLKLTNVDRIHAPNGESLPVVHYWEIGNEPYLPGDRPDLTLSPAEYAARANVFIPTLQRVDPSIQVGVPLLGPVMAELLPASHRHFTEVVLAALASPPNFFAVHNAYLPFYYGEVPPLEQVYRQVMASPSLVNRDLDALRAQINARFTGNIPFALTEYNALYTLGNPATDGLIASFTSALYVADLLLTLARRDDLLMANFWSLLNNSFFGSIDDQGRPHPAYPVLRAFSQVFHGQILPTDVDGPTFDAPPAPGGSLFPGATGLPTVTALALQDGKTITVILINKELQASQTVEVELSHPGTPRQLTSHKYTYPDVFKTFTQGSEALRWQPAEASLSGGRIRLTLEPHSVRIVTWEN